MNTLIVSRGLPPAGLFGLELYTQHLAEGLQRRGHQVVVCCPEPAGSAGEGVEVEALPRRDAKDFRASFDLPHQEARLREVLARRKPDVVHFLSLAGGTSCGLVGAAKQAGARVVLTLADFAAICHRGYLVDDQNEHCAEGLTPERCAACSRRVSPYARRWKQAERKEAWGRRLEFLGERSPFLSTKKFARRLSAVQQAMTAVDAFIAPTQAIGERHVAWGIPKDAVQVLPWALDPELYAGFQRTPRGEVFRFGVLGMFALHKGLHILVDAVRSLLGRATGFQVALHGQRADAIYPDYADILLERARSRGLPIVDKGPFPPDQLARVLGELDALLIPSVWQENLPITLLHARATRTPVIATRVDGIAEFVKTGIDGFLVTPGNSTSLAERMETLMTDAKVRGKLEAEVALPIGYQEHLARIEGVYAG